MPGVAQKNRRLSRVVIGLAVLAVAAGALAIAAWPRRAGDVMARARLAYERGDWPAALQASREVLKARPDDRAALRYLARSSVRLRRDDAALAIYPRLEEQALESEDYVLLGTAYERRGLDESAARAYRKAVEMGQLPPRSLDELACLHLRARRWKEAAPVAERLAQQPGWEARGSMMLGTIRASLENVSGAALSFQRALDLDPAEIDHSDQPVKLRKLIASTYLRMGRPALARKILSSTVAHAPDPEAAWLLSRTYLQEGDLSRAQAALVQAGSYRDDHPLEPEPAPYVGEARCQKCHAAVFRTSLASRHTQSFYRGAQLDGLPRPEHPLPDPDDPRVTHALLLRDGKLWEETRGGHEVARSVIEYAFGTIDRYLTMVSRNKNGEYHVARLSYYNAPEGRGWDRSALDKTHSVDRAGQIASFQGEPISVREGAVRCLFCHVTDPFAFSGQDSNRPQAADRAIGCERCHGPGGHHIGRSKLGSPTWRSSTRRQPRPGLSRPGSAMPVTSSTTTFATAT